MWQQYSEQAGPGSPSVEPSVPKLVNGVFGYGTVILNSGQSLNNGGQISQVGDEVVSEFWKAADSNAPVHVVELATYRGQTYIDSNGDYQPTNSYTGWFPKGNPNGGNHNILKDAVRTGQMVLPTPATSTTAGTTVGSFRPGTDSFGLVVENKAGTGTTTGEWTQYDLNPNLDNDNRPNFGQFFRFFPARDGDGVLIPNTYIVLHDYNRPNVTNYDFNDNIYLITNIIPENQTKSPPTLYGARNSGGVRLNWTSPTDGPRITGFNVYRSTSARGTYALLTGTPIDARPSNLFQDDTAVAGTTYYYAVASVGNAGESARAMVRVA